MTTEAPTGYTTRNGLFVPYDFRKFRPGKEWPRVILIDREPYKLSTGGQRWYRNNRYRGAADPIVGCYFRQQFRYKTYRNCELPVAQNREVEYKRWRLLKVPEGL